MMSLAEVDAVVHTVESHWSHPVMTAAGFVPVWLEASGLVRSFEYEHPSGHRIRASTGVNADHWQDLTTGAIGYWSSLRKHVEELDLG